VQERDGKKAAVGKVSMPRCDVLTFMTSLAIQAWADRDREGLQSESRHSYFPTKSRRRKTIRGGF